MAKLVIWPRRGTVESIVVRLTRDEVAALLRDGVLPEYTPPGWSAPTLSVLLEEAGQ